MKGQLGRVTLVVELCARQPAGALSTADAPVPAALNRYNPHWGPTSSGRLDAGHGAGPGLPGKRTPLCFCRQIRGWDPWFYLTRF